MDRQNPMILHDAAAWRAWLDENEDSSNGVWLLLARKGAAAPTTLTAAQALPEALCSGWIDGRRRGHDATMFLQHYTPRRRGSVWSERNTLFALELIDQGRMRPRGLAEIDRARADGRWERAYQGQATARVPADLQAALDASPAAARAFSELTSQPRYHILHQLMTARSPATRAKRIEKFVTDLERRQD